ncbi:MAG TPA: hypothetical protein VEJ87_16925, partial [Acidimicrobiales bacterium]|nr:hypothetical protein [Acidimicrobiales bacterium]
MISLVELIEESHEEWDPDLESVIFGTVDPRVVAAIIEDHVRHELEPVAGALFYRRGVGIVVGLRLVSGADAVVKIHRWNVTIERLLAVQVVQRSIAEAGLPAPRPLSRPQVLGEGIATIEQHLPGGAVPGHVPEIRRVLSTELFRFITAAS